MGLLDSIAGQVLGSLAGGNAGAGMQQSPLLQIIAALLSNQQGGGLGGLAGLIRAFQANGLGDIADSWVSTGQNQAISPQQLDSVLGGQLAGFAEQFGLSQPDLSARLSNLLPQVIDKMTPDGQVPQNDVGLDDVSQLLSDFLK